MAIGDPRRTRSYRRFAVATLRAGLTAALLSGMLVGTPRAEAAALRCAVADVTVHSPNPADAQSVCDAAADAVGFLGAQGLATKTTIAVFVVDKLPAPISATAFGGYIHAERRAYLLTSAKAAERGTVFNLPFDPMLYRGLATHEVAHAIAAFNFRIEDPPIEAEEYIAYVAMVAMLPAVYRDLLLARFADDRFDSEMEINTPVYLLDPLRFGVLAYKHFMTPGNGADFLQRVLAGHALLQSAY